MPNFADMQGKVTKRLQDVAGKLATASPGAADEFIKEAITQRYSKDRPREVTTDQAGSGTNDQNLPEKSGEPFEEGFSEIRQIEYPLGNVPETLLEDGAWRLYRTPSGLKLRLIQNAPSTSEQLRITWTLRHKDDVSTIFASDVDAVACYAASLCLEALAEIYAQTGDPSLSADVVNYRTKSDEYRSLAKMLRERYYTYMGIASVEEKPALAAAIAIGDMDNMMGSGYDRLTHPRSSR